MFDHGKETADILGITPDDAKDIDKQMKSIHNHTKYEPPISTTQALIEIAEKHINSDVSGTADVWMFHSATADKIIGQLLDFIEDSGL